MRAITVSAYGDAPAVTDLPKPQPGPGQILIKVHAAGMNPMDRMIANGALKATMPGTFPLVLGADVAGVVEAVGNGETKFARGDEVFGQLFVPPLGSTGTYAEYVAVTENAALARVPGGIDPVVAASLPTAGATALQLADSLEPLSGKTVLVVGAGGGVGSFFTQFAAQAGAHVIATARASAAGRLRDYGAAEIIDHTAGSLPDAVRRAHPDGIDVLVDVASDAKDFAALASLVRRGGAAVTTRYVADTNALDAWGVTGVNFRVSVSPEVLQRLADSTLAGRIIPPPITRVTLNEALAALGRVGAIHGEGKTVVTL
jgi:NADPH:quinone reductase-like Zn-dependent oxidoreductase